MASHDPGGRPPAGLPVELDRDLAAMATGSELPLPPYPAVALRVREAMARPEFGLDEVAHLVGSDAALAAVVLRCANSPMYRRGAPATTLSQAIVRVGAQEVMRLLLASCLASHAHAPGAFASLRRMVWLEGVAGAALCQELARLRGLKQEEAFLIGLLHRFGRIVACTCLESLVQRYRSEAHPVAIWSQLIERHQAALGLALVNRWQLPGLLANVILARHADGGGSPEESGLLDVVKTSDAIVELMITSPGVSSTDLTKVSGLGKFVEREALGRIIQKLPDFINAFEANGAGAESAPTRIALPDTTLAGGARPVRFTVTVNRGRQSSQYVAHSIAQNGLAMVGNEPLVDARLHETTIHSQPGPLHIWSLSALSRRESGAYHVELHPFALSGMERGLWVQLVSGAPAGA